MFRSFFCFALLCPLLSGDSDGEQNFPVSILPLAIGGHPGGLHQVQSPLDRVQEQPHILDDDGRLTSLGRGGEKGRGEEKEKRKREENEGESEG